MIPQSTFMVCAEILEDKIESLRALLATMNTAPGLVDTKNPLIPFAQFNKLHVARLVIVEHNTMDEIGPYELPKRPWPVSLFLLGDCDGPYQAFLAELAVRAAPGLRKIFAHCKNFNADKNILLAWMLERNVKPAANYINWLGRTVTQIHEEAELHLALKHQLQIQLEKDGELTSPDLPLRELHQSLRNHVLTEIEAGRLSLKPTPKTPWCWRIKNTLHLLAVPIVLLLLAPIVLILSPFYLIELRRLERSDPESTVMPNRKDLDKLAEAEDQLVTNQFSAFGDVKPGRFRRYTIVVLLFLLNYAARHIYRRGYLTRVRSIHFARWVLLDDKTRVFFASNYDSSLESYMDDFINKVAWGLNLVFSNGVGYPSTRWLLKDGAEQEQKFKRYLGRRRLHSDVWYKAYPDLTNIDLARNTRIRRGLDGGDFKNEDELRQWFSLI